MLTTPSGSLELAWPAIRSVETDDFYKQAQAENVRLLLHKFTAYMYNPTAIRYLAQNPSRKFVICMRDPSKSLVSWWNMHTAIANSDKNPGHFAYKERDFYSNCTVEEYYERFAKSRLNYDKHIQRAIELAGADRVLVVSQERMSQDIGRAGDQIMSFAVGAADADQSRAEAATHVSYAEKAKVELPEAIRRTLDCTYGATLVTIVRSGVRALI
jgi:hypothetical protein